LSRIASHHPGRRPVHDGFIVSLKSTPYHHEIVEQPGLQPADSDDEGAGRRLARRSPSRGQARNDMSRFMKSEASTPVTALEDIGSLAEASRALTMRPALAAFKS